MLRGDGGDVTGLRDNLAFLIYEADLYGYLALAVCLAHSHSLHKATLPISLTPDAELDARKHKKSINFLSKIVVDG